MKGDSESDTLTLSNFTSFIQNNGVGIITAKKLWDDFQKQTNSLGSLSSTLKGWHIVLDPGHGGLDPGAIEKANDVNKTTLFEKEHE